MDKTLPIGTDVSFYLDLSALISRGDKFLVDFFDYRVPVFPLLFSPIYQMGFSDFTNLFLMLLFIYSFYCLTLYFISFHLTRSSLKSFLAAILVFVSISSRQFDPGREISVPLFYHTVELVSLFALFKLLVVKPEQLSSKIITVSAILSGILWAIAFIGRQVHIAVPLVVGGFVIYLLYKNKPRKIDRKNWLIPIMFFAGLSISSVLALWIFYVPDTGYMALLKKWLLEIPPIIYGVEPLRIIKKFITTFYWGLPEMRNISLPIFWVTYLVAAAGFSVFFFSESVKDANLKMRSFYWQNKERVFFVLLVGFMTIATVLTTGSGAKSHESPFFTLFFFILVLVLSNIKLRRHSKNLGLYFFIILFLLPNAVYFVKKELKIHLTDWQNQETVSFPEKIADELKLLIKPRDTVLILGSYPTITRLVDYKPFMGNTNDTFLYSGQKLLSERYQEDLIKNLDKIDVAYKLPDYPNLVNLNGIRENTSNEAYLYIENYLKSKFEIASVIKKEGIDQTKTKNSYGNYTDRAIIYRRVIDKK